MTREERINFNHQLLKQSICSIHMAIDTLYWSVTHGELTKDVKQYKEACETLIKLSEISNKLCEYEFVLFKDNEINEGKQYTYEEVMNDIKEAIDLINGEI